LEQRRLVVKQIFNDQAHVKCLLLIAQTNA